MAKVVIELEFDAVWPQVLNCDVWDYLEELIEDESLDYTVYDGAKLWCFRLSGKLKLFFDNDDKYVIIKSTTGHKCRCDPKP